MAKEKGLYGLGLTDHGNMSAALELYFKGKSEGFPVVLGSEFYVVDDFTKKEYYHMTVWCKNAVGYRNLCTLSTMSYGTQKGDPHFYKKPRINYDELIAHKEGLIVGSGCYIGEINHCVCHGKIDQASYLLTKLTKAFGDDFYLEIMPAMVTTDKRMGILEPGDNLQEKMNAKLLDISKTTGIKYICSSDAHMPDKSLEIVQKIKMANFAKSKKERWEFDYIYYLHDNKEFTKQWTEEFGLSMEDFEVGCANTREIVDKCQGLKLEFEDRFPVIDHSRYPTYKEGATDLSLTLSLCRYHGRLSNDSIYLERLEREIEVLHNNGKSSFLSYFLLLEDVCRYCKKVGAIKGPARGSAGGSLLAYLLCITDIDPIKHDLSFERFINLTRIEKGTLPDIDLDFGNRDVVLDYLGEVYGREKVSSVGLIQTLKPKMAAKDAFRILRPDMPTGQVDSFAAAIPWADSETDISEKKVKAAIKESCDLYHYLKDNKDVEAGILNSIGQMRHFGTHAAAVVISPEDLRNFVPLMRKASDNKYYTQYSKDWCAKAGLIKYDILGLNTLNVIEECMILIKERHGLVFDPWADLPLDDKATLEAFNDSDTSTIFQFNTDAFKDLLRIGVVSEFNDLVVINTLGRPGTLDMGMHLEWVERRKGNKKIEYPHQSLAPVLKDTLGIILYQEQVMKSLQVLADFTDAEADDIRRAIGKKKTEVLERYKPVFLDRSVKKWDDLTDDKSLEIWGLMEAFGRYSFNLSHALAYSLISYAQQYMKIHYPVEYWCAVLRNEDDADKNRLLYKSIKQWIAPYDINKSSDRFQIVDDMVVPPINSIKFIGPIVSQTLEKMRPISSLKQFLDGMNNSKGKMIFKKHVVINMILGCLFDDVEPDMTPIEMIKEYYLQVAGAKIKRDGKPNKILLEFEQRHNTKTQEDLKRERMMLLPFNDIDLMGLLPSDKRDRFSQYPDVLKYADGSQVCLIGVVLDIYSIKDKRGRPMFFVNLMNAGETINLTVWHENAITYRGMFQRGKIVALIGNINRYRGKFSVILKKAQEVSG